MTADFLVPEAKMSHSRFADHNHLWRARKSAAAPHAAGWAAISALLGLTGCNAAQTPADLTAAAKTDTAPGADAAGSPPDTTTAPVDSATIANDVAPDEGAAAADGAAAKCVAATDCPIQGICLLPVCGAFGVCSYVPKAMGAACDDGNACTTQDQCSAGACIGVGQLACQDDNPCSINDCQPNAGCVKTPAAEKQPCDDGNACTQGEACAAGQCAGGTTVCQCGTNADCAKLEDGNLCNGTLYCDKATVPYQCKVNPSTVVACSVGLDSACQKNTCLPTSGQCQLIAAPANTACNDGDKCTAGDFCLGGLCQGGTNTCTCGKDADCTAQEDGNACNGILYCNKAISQCELNPATVVVCPSAANTACAKNQCNGKDGSCAMVAISEGALCNDGNPCTPNETCVGGVCSAKVNTCECQKDADCAAKEDGNICNGTLFCDVAGKQCKVNPATVVACAQTSGQPCVASVCEPGSGQCVPQMLPDGAACNDGLACTQGETCTSGKCQPTALGNLCECSKDADCVGKDDGNLCNGIAFCNKAAGKCQNNPATVVVCPVGLDTACAKNVCVPQTGQCELAASPTGTACEDGNPCTAGDACSAGTCTPGTVTCICQTDADCQKYDDGDVCNGLPFCDKSGGAPVCKINPATVVICPSVDDTPCKKTLCDKKTGKCGPQVTNNGAPCVDDDVCTVATLCQAGNCVGAAKACDDGDPCTADSCDGEIGCLNKPKLCLDDNLCTQDVCQGGKCLFLHTVGPCDDDNACTDGDICAFGKCKPGKLKDCDDGNLCTADVCGNGACLASAVTGTCDDGNPCTAQDGCAGGKCSGVQAKSCDDGLACTTDSCDPQTGACGHLISGDCTLAPCAGNGDCPGAGPAGNLVCSPTLHACVSCTQHSHCAKGKVCIAGACVPGAVCTASLQCKGLGQVCNKPAGLCVDCLTNSDCAAGLACLEHQCVPAKPCKSDKDCPAVCGKGVGFCVQCNEVADCEAGQTCGADLQCHAKKCTADGCAGATALVCQSSGAGYTATSCNDGNACSADECLAGKGCVQLPLNGATPTACDDNNACTKDACDSKAACAHVPLSDTACPLGTCQAGVCKRVVQVAMSYAHACAIDQSGALSCWGNNGQGQLGNGTNLDFAAPKPVYQMGAGVTSVCAGNEHSCAVKEGAVWCWGYNGQGQLGSGDKGNGWPTPQLVGAVGSAKQVACGSSTTCAVTTQGAVWCWGYNGQGQLGNGQSGANSNGVWPPAPVKFLGPTSKVVGDGATFCALTVGGAVFCWGESGQGQVGSGKSSSSQQVYVVLPEAVLGVADAVDVAFDNAVGCARTAAGKVLCWGVNSAGKLGVGANQSQTQFLAQATAVAMPEAVMSLAPPCAVGQSGAVYCAGANAYGERAAQPSEATSSTYTVLQAVSGAVAIAAGGSQSRCAILGSGKLVCWGLNPGGVLGVGLQSEKRWQPSLPVAWPKPIAEITLGYSHGCLRDADGGAACWGSNHSAQPAAGLGNVSRSAVPLPVAGLNAKIKQISAGYQSTCAVDLANAAWCWGVNTSTVLGSSAVASEGASPIAVSADLLGAVVHLSVGDGAGVLLRPDGTVWHWGILPLLGHKVKPAQVFDSSSKPLTAATIGLRSKAFWAFGAGNVSYLWGSYCPGKQSECHETSTAIAAGYFGQTTAIALNSKFGCKLGVDNDLMCFGNNTFGKAGKYYSPADDQTLWTSPSKVDGIAKVLAVAIVDHHACAIDLAGQPWCWGRNSAGQLGRGTASGDATHFPQKVVAWQGKAIQLALSDNTTCALRDDGKAFCWGSNNNGHLGDGSAFSHIPLPVVGLP